jgi:hypothetical protein
VVEVGETTWDPFTATAAPLSVALAAFVDVHVRVELPPLEIVVGFAVIAPVVTVSVTCPQSVAPAELWAVIRYVDVVSGETVCEPLRATVVPLRSAVAAFCVDQVSVELPPAAMVVGFSLMPAPGGPVVVTVTVAWAVVVAPEESFTMKVYRVVAVGDTICDPLTATEAPFSVALAAFVDVQVSLELPPGEIEVGLALMPAVAAPPPTVTLV